MRQILINSIVIFVGIAALAACSSSRNEERAAVGQGTAATTAPNNSNATTNNSVETKKTPPPVTRQAKQNELFNAFKKGEDYEKTVRPQIVKDGWQPAAEADSDQCGSGQDLCDKFPEMNHCAGTGLGNCEFRWQKGDKILLVYTIDDPQIYDSYEIQNAAKENTELIGKYNYHYTEDYGGDISVELQANNAAIYRATAEDSIADGQGTWKWDNDQKSLTITLPIINLKLAEEDKISKTYRRILIFKRAGEDLKIIKEIPSEGSKMGMIFKKI